MKYRFADILIDSSAHCVMHRAQVVRVTNIEFRLLEYLAQNADQICSREDVLDWMLAFAKQSYVLSLSLTSNSVAV